MNERDNLALSVTEFESQAEACFVGRTMASAHGPWGLRSVAMASAHGPWDLRSMATGWQGRILKDNALVSQTGSVIQDKATPSLLHRKKQQEAISRFHSAPLPEPRLWECGRGSVRPDGWVPGDASLARGLQAPTGENHRGHPLLSGITANRM